MPETKTFTKKTELVFTTIDIEKKTTILSKTTYYVAKFKYGNSKDNLEKASVTSVDLSIILDKLSRFLDCEIDERHYIIK